jgi:hypothetical protein
MAIVLQHGKAPRYTALMEARVLAQHLAVQLAVSRPLTRLQAQLASHRWQHWLHPGLTKLLPSLHWLASASSLAWRWRVVLHGACWLGCCVRGLVRDLARDFGRYLCRDCWRTLTLPDL